VGYNKEKRVFPEDEGHGTFRAITEAENVESGRM
jgi:hypothetical protein